MSSASTQPRVASRPVSLAWKIILLLIPLLTLAMLLWVRHAEVNTLRRRTVSFYGMAPTFNLTNQYGQPFGSAELTGKVWIADFIYTTCPGPCPMMTMRMSELQKPLEKTGVHLVSFTVDPSHDTPEVLRAYGRKWGAKNGRWDFLTGPQSAIYDISSKGFRLAATNDNGEKGIPIHSTRMVLIDRHGQIRGYYDATEADAMTRLLADTNHLLREQPN